MRTLRFVLVVAALVGVAGFVFWYTTRATREAVRSGRAAEAEIEAWVDSIRAGLAAEDSAAATVADTVRATTGP